MSGGARPSTASVVPTLRVPGRALVTGGAGFIGSHLVARLLEEGNEVLIVDDLSTGSSARVPSGARLETCDVATAAVERVVAAWRPTVVFHLAAQSSVAASVHDPIHDLLVNVGGTIRVARAARDAGTSRFVFVSSGGAIYGESRIPATERVRPRPLSPYGIHKLAGEGHVAASGLSYAIARPSNVYGAGQVAGPEGAVIAAFAASARAGRALRIDGDGRQTRDFVHVSDVVEALVLLAATERSGIWNVASEENTSIAALADAVERAVGRSLPRSRGPRRPGDVRHSALASKALRALGWQPAISLEDGIQGLLAPPNDPRSG